MTQAPSPVLAAQRRWLAHRRDDAARSDLVIGVCASFTAEPLESFLGAHLLDAGVQPSFSFADYNQVRQLTFDPEALVGSVHALIVLWRLEDVFGGELLTALDGNVEAFGAVVEGARDLGQALASMADRLDYPVVVSLPPYPAPVGVDIEDSAIGVTLARLHAEAMAAYSDVLIRSRARIADLSAWLAVHGVARAHDTVKELAYHQPYTTEFWYVLGRHLGDIVLREERPPPKCIVLDCDNTLWGGVIGEDGIGGIELGSAFPGSAFQEFQRSLKRLKQRGVLLAISSKNNPQEVHDVFTGHDDMVLREDDIAVWRVNWEPKSVALPEIAKELNIGLDSLVLIDDSSYELAEVATAVPDVTCLPVPEEIALLPGLLASSGLFRNMQVTAEDRARTAMVAQDRGRREAEATLSREEFLASLELVVDYVPVGDEHIARVAQLTNKTNQFNLTTIRRSEADVRALVGDGKHLVRAIKVSDKFGDYGLVGVAIAVGDGEEWDIDTFLMSCRVLGRGIETAFLARLVAEIRECGGTSVVGTYLPTRKNAQVADFYPRHGFDAVAEGKFRAAVEAVTPAPTHITLR